MGVLDGKVAIVTGAGRGLGREHALLMAAEGARVVVNDIGVERTEDGQDVSVAERVVQEIVAAGGSAIASRDNVTDWSGAEALIITARDAYGHLDILVNNAGVGLHELFIDTTEEQLDKLIASHIKGHMAPAQFAARLWRSRALAGDMPDGRVINTASEAGLFGLPMRTAYSIGKAGILAMTMVMARELAQFGVKVNAIAPRGRTPMTTGLNVKPLYTWGDESFDARAPENVSPWVVWLASPAAAEVSGQAFRVWGSKVELFDGYRPVAEIDAGNRKWTVDELTLAAPGLFGDRSPGVPETPGLGPIPFPTIDQ